jgi:hypothetical protein
MGGLTDRLTYEGERHSPAEALNLLENLKSQGMLILGVDGFIESEGKIMSPLDMILDLSKAGSNIDDRYDAAKRFMLEHAVNASSFEIVWDD